MTYWLKIAANRRILAYLLMSLILLGLIISMGILPLRQEISHLKQEQTSLESKIQEQKMLQPVYESLQQQLEEPEHALLSPQVEHNSSGFDVDNAQGLLSGWASNAGMDQANFSPQPDSLLQDDELMLVQGNMQGNYQAFRDFLIQLLTHPDLERMQSLSVQSTTAEPEYSIQLWVNIE